MFEQLGQGHRANHSREVRSNLLKLIARAANAPQLCMETDGTSGTRRNAESENKLDVRVSRDARNLKMTPTGTEQTVYSAGFLASGDSCAAPCAAFSADLQLIIDSWPALPDTIRAEILAAVRRVVPIRPAM